MGAHHLHRHRDRRRQAVNHLPQAIADQQHLAMRIEQLRHPGRIGGQHDDRHAGLGADLLAHVDAVTTGQHEVEEDEVRAVVPEHVHRLVAPPERHAPHVSAAGR